ncbi:YgfZ/GcvT domain-containing protein, partial [Wohlfahrtiimonas larvae]
TADMDHLDYLYDHPENSGLGGLCNVKGRLEAVFWIQKIENGFDLYLPKCISESIATLLKRFVFRSKVTIEVMDANDEFVTIVPQDFNIPWIIEATQGKYVPQMVSLDVLKGVHPRKGCYIGQEIVTRLRDLGKNKKRLGKISLGKNGNINIGDTIHTDNDVVAGEIVLVQENEALAVLVLAELHQTLKLSDNIELLNVWKDDNE